MTLTPEDFAAWREHPVTDAVIKALSETADATEQRFKEESWAGATPERLTKLREQVLAYRDLIETLNAPDAHEKLADSAE